MATGWVKSLQCKSRAFEDVYQPTPKALNLVLPTSGCRKSYQNLKDVVENTPKKPKKPKKRHPPNHPKSPPRTTSSSSPPKPTRARNTSCLPARALSESYFPALTELAEGHSSRNVVEIIFRTSWCLKSAPGRIEMVFKVQNPSKTVARFEEYREMVKSRACPPAGGGRKEENARCVADGNELMRFHCVGPTGGDGGDCPGGLCTFSAGKGGAIRTFSGSGGAHESVGGGKGRRAMLVCRVIAGRVCKGVDSFLEGCVGGFESVSGENGALVVFDSRALLPCFLIIYAT